jgi:peptidoglycan hydrolase-like protein with peptidoglycan-binding domain
MVFGFNVDAQTDTQTLIAQLQAQIQLLMQQVAQLRSQQGGQNWCHTFNSNLGIGSRGDEVLDLIIALDGGGSPANSSSIGGVTDPYYSKDTAADVVQFQAKYGITPQSGYVGVKTRAKLNSLYGCAPTPTPTPASAPTPVLTPAPTSACSNLYWFDNTSSAHSLKGVECTAQKQFCGAYMYSGLRTFDNQKDCFAALTLALWNCAPNWTCSWYTCLNGHQTQFAADSNKCPSTVGSNLVCPPAVRACVTPVRPPSLTVTSPNGGEQWELGSTQGIEWVSNSVSKANIAIISYKDGSSYRIKDGSSNDLSLGQPQQVPGEFWQAHTVLWEVGTVLGDTPQLPLGQYWVEISDAATPPVASAGLSKSFFSIVAATPKVPRCSGDKMADGSNYDYKTDKCVGYRCSLGNDSSGNPRGFSNTCYNAGDYSKQSCDDLCVAGCVYIPDYKSFCSNTPCPSVTVTSPNGGEQWAQGSTHTITWDAYCYNRITSNPVVGITLIGNNQSYSIPSNLCHVLDGNCLWIIGRGSSGPVFSEGVMPPPGQYKIEVSAEGGAVISGDYFTITAP